jgi:uncharacterized membrane protein
MNTSSLALSSFGIFHTAISLIAVAAGIIAFVRDREIDPSTRVGRLYVITTVITCVTGFGIFRHASIGPAHLLGVVTLIVLGIAAQAGKGKLFGRASPYVETVGYSATFFFHMIPAITETATRLPVGKPLASSQEDPFILAAVGIVFVVFLISAALQVRRLRADSSAPAFTSH